MMAKLYTKARLLKKIKTVINLLKKLKVLSISALLMASSTTVASADPYYDTFRIYVAGPYAGQVEYKDEWYKNNQFPNEACGVRVHNPTAWYWAANGNEPMTLGELPGNEMITDQLEFTGAYEGCNKELPYVFTTPVTPNGDPPLNAEVLIIQADPRNIEWLDYNNKPIPPVNGGIGIPDLDLADPCKVREFCEPDPNPPCSDISVSLFDCVPLDFNAGNTRTNGNRPSIRVDLSNEPFKRP
ncbi:hypothetical protein LC612_35410 [Nostoc sp. CHAB 5834]|nr:hypothetical protein [Nostoc sp. CHAB 5834]